MHELSLAEAVLERIQASAREQSFTRVSTIWLEIGQLACVEVEAMKFCFDAVARGTLAEGATLEIISTPGKGWCARCARESLISEPLALCTHCGEHGLKLTGGTEMRVKELAVA